MTSSKLSILQVTTSDVGGGAERIARTLFESYRAIGLESWLAVGYKRGNDLDPDILPIPNNEARSRWARFWLSADPYFKQHEKRSKCKWALRRAFAAIGDPVRGLRYCLGHEDFNFPGSRRLLTLPSRRPDIVHAHNLHGAYFDLRIVPEISAKTPTVITLHDSWMLSGHCAHSFDCDRWEAGCGKCPDLSLYPAILRDATARNWKVKREIYCRSRLYIATPCRWLMHKVERSILRASRIDSRVIPNGINLDIFHPMDRASARSILDLPPDAVVLLFVAAGASRNIWKDFDTLRSAIARIAGGYRNQRVILLALGASGPTERIGSAELRYAPYQDRQADVAKYYAASDLYLHAARADTFPNATLEALACGIPVVATAVGGIPEQIQDGKTGFLVPERDPIAMAARAAELLNDASRRAKMGQDGALDARARFDINDQIGKYLEWYQEILGNREMIYSRGSRYSFS